MAVISSLLKGHSSSHLARWHEFGDALTPEMSQQSFRSLQTDLNIRSEAKNDGEIKKIIAMEGQRLDISGLGYPVEWLFDVWIQNARAGHSRSSDPDEQG